MALFGNKEEKAAQDQAAQVEVERLRSPSAVELAVELMPAFGPDGPKPDSYLNQLQVALLKATRLGEDALAEGTVADHLKG